MQQIPLLTSSADTSVEDENDSAVATSSTVSERMQLPRPAQTGMQDHDLQDSVSVTNITSQPESQQRSSPEETPNDDVSQTPTRKGDGNILPRDPSRGHLEPESPLSPKDIRDRLAGETWQSNPHKGGLSSPLTFGLLARTEKVAPVKEENLNQAVVSSDDSIEESQSSANGERREGESQEEKMRELWKREEEDATNLHQFEDAETSSVLSIEQLTESLQTDSPQPVPLPTSFARFQDREKTPTPLDDVTSSPTVPLPLLSSPSAVKTAPLPSKYSKVAVQSPVRMPEHLKLSHRPAEKSHLSLPPSFVTDLLQDPWTNSLPSQPTQIRSRPSELSHQITPSSSVVPLIASSSDRQLAEALHSKAHLEGQLESVMEECRALLKERAELNSKLVVIETELEERNKETRDGRIDVVSMPRNTELEVSKLREELKLSQRELERERKALVVVKEDSNRRKMSVQQLQAELKKMKEKAETQEVLVEELRERLREATNKLAEEKMSAEEAQHQLHSLQGGYQALEDSKVWMQEQLQEALEGKIKLQEQVRDAKASSITNTFKMDQLARENASFQQQIASLQKGVLQDKAKLVNELEAIEVDILSREDAYARLVSEKAQLEELAHQRTTEIEKLSVTLGQTQVERDELRAREEERREKEDGLSQQCSALQKSKSDVERRLQETGEELAVKEDDIEQLQKLKSSLQERLRQSEAALVSKQGTLQGLRDSRDILRQELDMVKQAQQRVEGELEEERRQVARLEASLEAAGEGSSDEEGVVKSLTDMQQHLETENRALREGLAEKEREVKEREREVAALQEAIAKFHDLVEQLHSTASERDAMKEGLIDRDRTIKQLMQEKLASNQEAMSFKSDRYHLQSRLNTTLQQKSRLEGLLAEQSSLGELEHLQVAVKERTALQKQLDSLKLTHQQEVLRAQARQGQMEAELKATRREAERALGQAEKALQAKEEITGKMAELKSQTKSDLSELKCALEGAQLEKQVAEREAMSLKAELEELREHSRRLEQDTESMREKLVHESAHKSEVQGASEMVALKLKQNAEQQERELQEQNQSLSLELERLKGRLAGISTTQQALRSHTIGLESALAQRESSLAKVNAELQRLLEEQQSTERQVHTQTTFLKEEAASLRAELAETQERLHSEQERADELSEELTQTSSKLSQVRMGLSTEGRSVSALEERMARLSKARDELRMELTTVKAQLVMAKTATETSERELADRRAQVEILQQKLSASDAQCRQAEREADELRRELQRAGDTPLSESGRESTTIEGGGKRAAFDMSLSTIGGDETDSVIPGPQGMFLVLMSVICIAQ